MKLPHVNMSTTTGSSGSTIPTANYVNSISSDFPNPNRAYKVESTITNRYLRDYAPTNAHLSNGVVEDNYIEFILNSNQQEFLDCTSLALEMKMKIVDSKGEAPGEDAKISVIDGLGHRILSRMTLYFNGIPIETNNFFGLWSALKTYTSMSKDKLDSVGRNMFYKSLSHDIIGTFNSTNFPTTSDNDEQKIAAQCKSILHFVTPLHLDVGTGDFYLMNGVDVRLRFDLSPASLLINSTDNVEYNYKIFNIKLWAQKVVPTQEALMSLNHKLINYNAHIEYIVDRPIIKNYVFGVGQSILSLDNIFNGVVPHMVYVFFMKQKAINGAYTENGANLIHCDMSSLRLDLNGNTVTSLSSKFPDEIANLFHNTLFNLKDSAHLLTHHNFKNGRTIHTFDLTASDCRDDLKIEKSGNLRLTIQLKTPNVENISAFIIGITNGLIELDSARRVKTSYLM